MIVQRQEMAKPYIVASERERESEEGEKCMEICTNLGKKEKVLLLSLFRKNVLANKLRKLTL